ncbi:Peptidase family M28 [Flavobacteriaceae bacterium MAR_2010_188]|nr:Peptidase family M28 [Flavobacteriaceae bacterium MAR_2010_188]
MKFLIVVYALTLVGSCATKRYSDRIQDLKDNIQFEDIDTIAKYANTINEANLKNHVYTLSSNDFEGRQVGRPGHDKVVNYLKSYYQKENISSPVTKGTYLQTIPRDYFTEDVGSSSNVIAFLEGSEIKNEVLILTAHSDHLGLSGDSLYPGADDNASGTSALLEIARAFEAAAKNGYIPKRSIAFMHLTGEEIGLYGSRYFIENPLFPLDNIIADLNIDMIGRIDNLHKHASDYIYIIGADRLSKELHFISEKANSLFTKLDLDYKYNDEKDPNGYYYRSDHYNFARYNIPVIFYFNGEHDDYHKVTDTPDKINYALLTKRSKLIFSTAWYLANTDHRPSLDKLP